MGTDRGIILHTLRISRDFLGVIIRDFSAEELLRKPAHGGNPVAFTLGHLIAVELLAFSRIKMAPPELVPAGFAEKFMRGNKPPEDAGAYGDPLTLFPTFVAYRNVLMEAVGGLPAETFGVAFAPPPGIPLPIYATVGEALNFIGMHTHMHAGQITMSRRSYGRGPLL